jgi:hypothetical protein
MSIYFGLIPLEGGYKNVGLVFLTILTVLIMSSTGSILLHSQVYTKRAEKIFETVNLKNIDTDINAFFLTMNNLDPRKCANGIISIGVNSVMVQNSRVPLLSKREKSTICSIVKEHLTPQISKKDMRCVLRAGVYVKILTSPPSAHSIFKMHKRLSKKTFPLKFEMA